MKGHNTSTYTINIIKISARLTVRYINFPLVHFLDFIRLRFAFENFQYDLYPYKLHLIRHHRLISNCDPDRQNMDMYCPYLIIEMSDCRNKIVYRIHCHLCLIPNESVPTAVVKKSGCRRY